MTLVLTLATMMALCGAGLAYARVRRAASEGTPRVHAWPARGPRNGGARFMGLALLLAGGCAAQAAEQLFMPLSRPELLKLAALPALLVVATLGLRLHRRRALLPGGVFALLGAALLVYALVIGANGALDGAAPVTERVTVLDKERLRSGRDGLRHVTLVQRAGAATPVALTVDVATWDAIAVGRDSAVLTTRLGRLGVRWVEGDHALLPAQLLSFGEESGPLRR